MLAQTWAKHKLVERTMSTEVYVISLVYLTVFVGYLLFAEVRWEIVTWLSFGYVAVVTFMYLLYPEMFPAMRMDSGLDLKPALSHVESLLKKVKDMIVK